MQQAVILKDPAQLGVSEFTPAPLVLHRMDWHSLPAPTATAADAVLRGLNLRRTAAWLVNDTPQERVVLTAPVQPVPSWTCSPGPNPPRMPHRELT